MFIHYPSTNFLKGIGPFPHFTHFCQLLSPSSPHNESTPDSSQSISPISFSRSPKNIQKSDAHHVTKAPVISAGLRSLPGHHNSVAIPSGTLWCSTSWSMGALSPGMRVPQNPGYCLLSMGKPLGCTHILGNLHVSENGEYPGKWPSNKREHDEKHWNLGGAPFSDNPFFSKSHHENRGL